MVEDQKESLWGRRSYFMCVCGTCVNWASTKREIIFLVVSVCQVKIVSIAQYPIQCLNGLSRPTTATAPEPRLSKKARRNSPQKTLAHKKWNKLWEEIQKEILLPLLQYVCQKQKASDVCMMELEIVYNLNVGLYKCVKCLCSTVWGSGKSGTRHGTSSYPSNPE